MANTLTTAPPAYHGHHPTATAPPAEWFAMVERENGARVLAWTWITITDPTIPDRWIPRGIRVILADAILEFDAAADGTPGLATRVTSLYAPTTGASACAS